MGAYWFRQFNTRAWYVDGGKKTSLLNLNMVFNNGQKAALMTWGLFQVHRPTLESWNPSPPFYAFISDPKGWMGRPYLQLGEDYGNIPGSMCYSVRIRSDFAGEARWTQLINKYRHRDELPPIFTWYSTTGGDFYADGGEFYGDLSVNVSAGSLSNPLPFGDGPGNPVGLSVTDSLDQFKCYVRFCPTNPESIYVTLGRVDWSWQANAVNLLGYPYNTIPGNWHIEYQYVPPPELFDDSAFPNWNGVSSSISF